MLTQINRYAKNLLPNPESHQGRGTQVLGANRHPAKGNLIDPSPSANLVGVDEENLRNRTEVFPPPNSILEVDRMTAHHSRATPRQLRVLSKLSNNISPGKEVVLRTFIPHEVLTMVRGQVTFQMS